MKKVFAILAIAGFVACNNAETAAPAVDSPKVETAIDTTKKDTMAPVVVDTTKAATPAPAAH